MITPRHAYNYDADKVSAETGLNCEDKSKAIQSQAKDADINEIIRRFKLTGELPQRPQIPMNNAFIDVTDFRSAMQQIREAQEAFDALPAQLRERFGNDPATFVDFCSAEGNEEEMRKLGLLPKEDEPEEKQPVTEPEPAKT